VAPNAILFINDYNTTIPAKRACLFALVADLKARHIPVDGVGHQMHNNLEFPPVSDMVATLDLFATLGVTQHVTEMDVSIYTGSSNAPIANYDEIPAERFLRQARHYRDYFQVFRDHKDQLTSVTLWGLADDSTWLTSPGRVNGPLLFDDQLHHKLAYDGVVNPETLPKDPASVSLSDLAQTYDGGPHAVTVTTTPPGLPVDVRYDGSTAPPVNAGTYHVDAAIDHPNWAGSAQGTLVVERAPAEVVLGGLFAAYTGAPRVVTVTTVPAASPSPSPTAGAPCLPRTPARTRWWPRSRREPPWVRVRHAHHRRHHARAPRARRERPRRRVGAGAAAGERDLNGGAAITGDLLVPGRPPYA
jgi:endo-1,4-beta-xylanase